MVSKVADVSATVFVSLVRKRISLQIRCKILPSGLLLRIYLDSTILRQIRMRSMGEFCQLLIFLWPSELIVQKYKVR